MPKFPKGSFGQAGTARGGAGKVSRAGTARGKASTGTSGQAGTARGSANMGYDGSISAMPKEKPTSNSGMQGSASE